MTEEQEQALQLATEAGHILLENGAEISRVEETMTRIMPVPSSSPSRAPNWPKWWR